MGIARSVFNLMVATHRSARAQVHGLWPSPTAVLDDPATQWIPYRATGSDGSTAMVELTSGVALWYHGGPPRLPIRWVVIRYLEERRGPYALLCTDVEAEPLRILQWYLLRWQVEVTPYQVRGRLFEELRAHLGMETQRRGRNEPSRGPPPRSLACSAW